MSNLTADQLWAALNELLAGRGEDATDDHDEGIGQPAAGGHPA